LRIPNLGYAANIQFNGIRVGGGIGWLF